MNRLRNTLGLVAGVPLLALSLMGCTPSASASPGAQPTATVTVTAAASHATPPPGTHTTTRPTTSPTSKPKPLCSASDGTINGMATANPSTIHYQGNSVVTLVGCVGVGEDVVALEKSTGDSVYTVDTFVGTGTGKAGQVFQFSDTNVGNPPDGGEAYNFTTVTFAVGTGCASKIGNANRSSLPTGCNFLRTANGGVTRAVIKVTR